MKNKTNEFNNINKFNNETSCLLKDKKGVFFLTILIGIFLISCSKQANQEFYYKELIKSPCACFENVIIKDQMIKRK